MIGCEKEKAEFVAEIDKGISTKEELFEVLAQRLIMPDYFGRNWDALSDMLRDLSWISSKVVRIVHKDVPCLEPVTDLNTYLEVLRYCADNWSGDKRHELKIEFQ